MAPAKSVNIKILALCSLLLLGAIFYNETSSWRTSRTLAESSGMLHEAHLPLQKQPRKSKYEGLADPDVEEEVVVGKPMPSNFAAAGKLPVSPLYRPTPMATLRTAAKVYVPDIALPEAFDESKQPCWLDKASATHRCLPSFMLLGVYQSGAHDLYQRIAKHEAVARNPGLSPSFYSEVHPWSNYMAQLAPATKNARAETPQKVIGECSAVTYHFTWVHQEQFNQAYVKAMGAFWKQCTGRTDKEKLALPHRDCMAKRMPEARAADAAVAQRAGLGNTSMLVPQLVRAVYGNGYEPALIVTLRLPWNRMHSAFYNYQQYGKHFGGANAEAERKWAEQSVSAFRRCEANFSTSDCALRFESLAREHEEVFYHCDQLIKGMYSIFTPAWRKEHRRILFVRSESYFADVQGTLKRAMAFVGLTPPADTDAAGWAKHLNGRNTIHGTRPKEGTPPMAAPTKALLTSFYRPGLRELAEQLSDLEDAKEWKQWSLSE